MNGSRRSWYWLNKVSWKCVFSGDGNPLVAVPCSLFDKRPFAIRLVECVTKGKSNVQSGASAESGIPSVADCISKSWESLWMGIDNRSGSFALNPKFVVV